MPPFVTSKAIRLSAYSALAIVALVLFISVAFKATFGAPVIRIKNETNSVLHEIRVFNPRWEHKIDSLSQGSETEFVQHVGGESGLSISFVANGRSYETGDMGYFEESGGYCVDVVIHKDFTIRSHTELGCFRTNRLSRRALEGAPVARGSAAALGSIALNVSAPSTLPLLDPDVAIR